MSAATVPAAEHLVSDDLRRVAVKSWKAPMIFGIFAVLFTLLPLLGPRAGVTTFRLAAGHELFALPDFVVPATATAWGAAIVLLLCAAFSAYLTSAGRKNPLWLTILYVVALLVGFLAWAAAGGTIPMIGLLGGALALATPLVYGALGGVIGERVGVVNIAIEAQLLAGAFCAAVVGSLTHSPWAGLVAAMVAGVLVSLILGVFAITYFVDQVIVGVVLNVLVIGVEKLSDFTDLTDRGTAFIFGDGAGAVIVGPSDEPRIGPTVWGSDGAQWDAIANNKSWLDYRASEQRPEDWPYLTMQGRAVFRWAVWKMSPAAKQAMDVAGVTPDDLDVFLPHQANIRIIDAMVKELKLPDHVKVARDIVDNGNTSAASIPMAMDRMLADSEASSGDLALMIGYGAGLAYAGQVAYLP